MGATLGASELPLQGVAPMSLTDTAIRNAKPGEKTIKLLDVRGPPTRTGRRNPAGTGRPPRHPHRALRYAPGPLVFVHPGQLRKAMVDRLGAPGERAEATYQSIIAALLDCIAGTFPASTSILPFPARSD